MKEKIRTAPITSYDKENIIEYYLTRKNNTSTDISRDLNISKQSVIHCLGMYLRNKKPVEIDCNALYPIISKLKKPYFEFKELIIESKMNYE